MNPLPCWSLPLDAPPIITLMTSFQIGKPGESNQIVKVVNEARDWAVVVTRGSGHLEICDRNLMLPIESGRLKMVPPRTPISFISPATDISSTHTSRSASR